VSEGEQPDARAFIKAAVAELHTDVDSLGQRINYPSLKRAMQGEINFPDSRRQHIQDLLLLARAYNPKDVMESQSLEVDHFLPSTLREDPPRDIPVLIAHNHEDLVSVANRLAAVFRTFPDAPLEMRQLAFPQIEEMIARLKEMTFTKYKKKSLPPGPAEGR